MQLTLIRDRFTDESTTGKLYIDGDFQCYTLEDPVREIKIKSITAIPAGDYKIEFRYSPSQKKEMPYILKVPNFTGILFHVGNFPKDTRGCPLVGTTRKKDYIGNSRVAFKAFEKKLLSAKNGLYITITTEEEDIAVGYREIGKRMDETISNIKNNNDYLMVLYFMKRQLEKNYEVKKE